MRTPPAQLWQNRACVILASGPSLAWDDYADVKAVQTAGLKTIAINTTWSAAKFCDVLYAGDLNWWQTNPRHPGLNPAVQKYTCSKKAAVAYGAKYWQRVSKSYNSGANAIDLAANVYKSPLIILLGCDVSLQKGIHHHGAHTKSANPTEKRLHLWHKHFAAAKAAAPNARIINCSRYTTLKCFEQMPLQQALNIAARLH